LYPREIVMSTLLGRDLCLPLLTHSVMPTHKEHRTTIASGGGAQHLIQSTRHSNSPVSAERLSCMTVTMLCLDSEIQSPNTHTHTDTHRCAPQIGSEAEIEKFIQNCVNCSVHSDGQPTTDRRTPNPT
jgi:hypothetical protein